MAALRAFVGHSFTSDDASLIRKFTDYFSQIAEIVPEFSWVHAEPAEPKQLAEKVMGLISDTNVFIAICTRKERTVQSENLVKRKLRNGFILEPDALQWKTSDWIIQEIGLALGKGLNLILLIEKGVREPGELQGNIEHIAFDRNAPEQVFGKLLEMIRALLPRARETAAAPADIGEASSAEQGEKSEAKTEGIDWENPAPGWSRPIYEFAFRHFVVNGDQQNATRIDQAYLATEDAKDANNKDSWEAYCEYRRIVHGMNGNLNNLEQLAQENQNDIAVQRYLGLVLEHYQDYHRAAHIFETAANEAGSDSERMNLGGMAAAAYIRGGLAATADRILNDLRAVAVKNPDFERALLHTIKEIADITHEKELGLAALERILQLNPTDTWSRFDLAYSYSQSENNDLSLFHYLKIPHQQRTQMAWNNLGAAYDELRLRARSVQAYRQAADRGETLAMSNLAVKFISVGFLQEAQIECDRALAIPDYHKNMGRTLARLREVPDDETERL